MSQITLPSINWRVVLNRATPPDSRGWGRVRAAQLSEMGRAMTIASWGQAFNALFLVVVLDGFVSRTKLAIWLLLLALLLTVTTYVVRKWRKREIRSVSRRAIDRAAYHSLFFAALWSMPATFAFPLVEFPQQLAICLVTVSMMAGAVFIFATVPPAAGTFILMLGMAASNMLGSSGFVLMKTAVSVYTAALCLMLIANGRAFMQRKCVELELEERTETVSLLLREYENSDADWLWQTNSQLCFQNVSSRFARAIGRRAEELEGKSMFDLLPRGRSTDVAAGRAFGPIASSLEKKAPFTEVVIPIIGRDGTRSIALSARPRFNSQGRFLGYRGVGADVTEARKAADRIEHMARHDALTALPNRLQLTEELGNALTRAKTGDGQCAILLIDLDRFKTVNDSLGHVAGDHLLQQVSSRFAPFMTSQMMIGRLGGDEFALIIPQAMGKTSVAELSGKIIDALKEPFLYNDQHLFVGASIGIAFGPSDGGSVEELIRNADLALYRAKGEGGNKLCFYKASLHADAEERRQTELALRSAIDENEFSLVYQPVVDAKTSRIQSFEALLRWSNPALGEMSPSKFIPIAEETGLLNRIGEWVLRTACAEAATWPAHISIAVNVSPRQLEDPAFALNLVSALSQSGLDPQRLELEVTETVFLNVTPGTQRVLQQIRSLGVRLAMDDFGTGYSSLGYLREFDFDTLKVDRSFIKGLSKDDPGSGAIVKAVVALAGSLGMKSVAEGVETEEQLEMVKTLGCTRIQGFLISEGLTASQAKNIIAGSKRRAAA